MIDRKARDQMAVAIRSYMDERITSLKFDDALWETAHATQDKSVWAVADALGSHYSDLEDHKIVVSKPVWDYFNRLLLILESDAELEIVRTWGRFNFRNALAALCLAGFALVALRAGIGKTLIVYWVFSVLASALFLWARVRGNRKFSAAEIAITPFPSITSLLSIRRQVRTFAKKRYSKSMSRKANRHALLDKMMWIPRSLFLVLCAPLVLLFLALPDREFTERFNMPEPERATDALPAPDLGR